MDLCKGSYNGLDEQTNYHHGMKLYPLTVYIHSAITQAYKHKLYFIAWDFFNGIIVNSNLLIMNMAMVSSLFSYISLSIESLVWYAAFLYWKGSVLKVRSNLDILTSVLKPAASNYMKSIQKLRTIFWVLHVLCFMLKSLIPDPQSTPFTRGATCCWLGCTILP